MPREGEGEDKGERRTDLPPEKDPYYEGYFGTDEEEGVVREEEEQEAPEGEGERAPPQDPDERARRRAEESAGGDREI